MGDVLALAGLAHAVALDGLGEDQGRLALVLHRGVVGGVDLERIMAAAGERPDLVVGHVGDQRLRLGVLAEEVLADVGAVLRLEVLVLAVDALLHAACAACRWCPWRAARPSPSPRCTLITFQPAPRKCASSSWMILPLPRTGPSRRCRLQLMTKIRLSSFSRAASEIAPRHSGSSISPSPRNAQTLRLVGVGEPAVVQVLEEARLVDRHQRPEPHRDGRELPEVGHQPGMRIGREPLAVDLLAEVQQLLLA